MTKIAYECPYCGSRELFAAVNGCINMNTGEYGEYEMLDLYTCSDCNEEMGHDDLKVTKLEIDENTNTNEE